MEALGAIEPAIVPGWSLVSLRITMEPGAEIAGHSHPGPVVLVVDSGIFVTQFIHGTGTITRASVDGAPAATEVAETGVEVTLNPGDALFVPLGWWHQVASLDFSVTITHTNFRWPNDFHVDYPG